MDATSLEQFILNNLMGPIDIDSLSDRKRCELEFHDSHRNRSANKAPESDTYDKFYGNKKYYQTTRRSVNYIHDWIRKECANKVFLDYACGDGKYTVMASQSGAKLSLGIDISNESILNARHDSSDIRNTIFFQADCENTRLPDNSIDTILCSGMLHHLDLSYAFYELRRIIKPGGKILCVEALDYNPAIKLYRVLTPEMRTDWEKAHILSMKDLDLARRFFAVGNIKYWHVTGYLSAKIKFLTKPTEIIDRLLEKIPIIQRLSWIFTFELTK